MSHLSVITEADGFALAMLVMLTLSLGAVLLILIRIARNASKQNDETDSLIDEAGREPVAPSGEKGKPESEPWAKDADWWKT